MNKISVSHPTSNQNNREVVMGFKRANMLLNFYTSIAVFPNSFLYKFRNIGVFKEVVRRQFHQSLRDHVKTWPINEIIRLLANKAGYKNLTKHEVGKFSVDNIYQKFDAKVAKELKKSSNKGVEAIYAYEDGAYNAFVKAKQMGLKCIYDLPIAYWQTSKQLLEEEAIRLPEWAATIKGGLSNSEEKLKRKTKELELADVVVVPSHFVKNSLPKWAQNKKVIMTPFGSPESALKTNISEKKISDHKLRVLFVGSMTQRKGLGDLFEAMKLVDTTAVELVVLGSLAAPLEFYTNKTDFIHEKGRPHDQVLQLMQSCDVFCLPSLVEGRALVMQEAMSQGLPLIITPNTGGEDLVIEGETGFLVPIRDPKAIAQKINWFIENKSKIPTMGEKAREHASKYTWENYSKTIVEALKNL
ncbi:glycosyltransferase family 4 protein [Tamlana sp. 62-3]|uniref:Glycosyltransferase family 4 protein n=1 Tax=Neotamlana sargassicola TaxID=2883125 RepID=A0A9X1L5G0_9FLAO|nr:glycosyltransferase family 4 protein [Tamlana sargassicola]MCB4809212.1 glycosyltransferase family 4 protein [Tamlana sargassicola]